MRALRQALLLEPAVEAHELAGRLVLQRQRGAGVRVDQLGMDEAVRAQVHAVLLLALAPQRHVDIADPHRLGHARAPAVLQRGAERRLAAAGLAGIAFEAGATVLLDRERTVAAADAAGLFLLALGPDELKDEEDARP